jgi:hypothetical protein
MKRSCGNVEFENSPFRRYLSYEGDDKYRFALQNNGTYKFKSTSIENNVLVTHHGDVGTDGVTDREEFDDMRTAIRTMHTRSSEDFMSDDPEVNYSTYKFIMEEKEYEKKQELKKSKIAKAEFPSLTGKVAYPPISRSRTNWTPVLQEFLSTYGYLGDFYYYDYSSPDMSKWKFYQAVDPEDVDKDSKKFHNALLKKSSFMKNMSKENPGMVFKPGENVSIMEKILQVSIDGTTYYVLSMGMCDNDPLGHYNVLLNNRKKEIFRIDVTDSDATVDDDGEWKTSAMKSKYKALLNQIEPFITSSMVMGAEGEFEFDWEDEVFMEH